MRKKLDRLKNFVSTTMKVTIKTSLDGDDGYEKSVEEQ